MLASLLGKLFRRPWQMSRARRVSALLRQSGEGRELAPESLERMLRRVLELDPLNAEANHKLGVLHAQRDNLADAVSCLQQAIRTDPGSAGAHVDLGNVLRLTGEPDSAAAAYRRAIELDAPNGAAYYNLGALLRQSGQPESAVAHLEKALALMPAHLETVKELVLCLVQLARFDEALALLESILPRAPRAPDLHAIRGLVYQKALQPQMAWQCYQRAQALGASDADFFNNCGIVLQDLGELEAALENYDRALALRPGYPLAQFHRGLARLMLGDFEEGWIDYEARLLSEDRPRRPTAYPRWDGSKLEGRALLIWGEQGLGDEIMFASCLPHVFRAGGRCVIECSPKLQQLFRRSFPEASVYAATPQRDVASAIEAERIDVELPIGSLPLHFRRSLAAFPHHRGYLHPDPVRVTRWRGRLANLGAGLKVGLSWRGGTHKTRSALRSVPLADLREILTLPGARFVSLQYTDCAKEIADLKSDTGVAIEHWPEAIADYDETAALVSSLDVVVSVCTALIHLTGALGQRVFIMAPHSPEWRYGFAGDSMPWYPSARIFRQPRAGDWAAVIGQVRRELCRMSANGISEGY